MAKFKDIKNSTKNSAKDIGYKENIKTTSASNGCYTNSVADNVKTQKKTSFKETERRDGPGGN